MRHSKELARVVFYLKGRFPRAGELLDGTRLVRRRAGVWQDRVMQGMHVAEEDVPVAARLNGCTKLEQIDYAICPGLTKGFGHRKQKDGQRMRGKAALSWLRGEDDADSS